MKNLPKIIFPLLREDKNRDLLLMVVTDTNSWISVHFLIPFTFTNQSTMT